MFEIKGEAELKNINVRAEIHGEELVRAIDVKLVMTDVDAKLLNAAVPGLVKTFWDGEQPAFQELYPLKIRHKIENATAEIKVGKAQVQLLDVTMQKIEVTPLFGKRCQIAFTVRSQIGDGILDSLHAWLKGKVNIEIEERQMEIPGMAQA
jgi:hypothetical protein